MKKILNISVIAALAILPMAANAAVTSPLDVTVDTVDSTHPAKVAGKSYVQGAYNALAGVARNHATQIDQNTADIATKQAQLQNDAGTPVDIDATVRTTVGATGDDTHLVTEKAVRDAITTANSSNVTLNGTQTLTGKTIDGDDNTIQDLGTGVFKSGVLVNSTTGIAATSSASDSKMVTEKAVATALEGKQNTIDASNKLNADNVDDSTSTNKFVTAAEKTAIANAANQDLGNLSAAGNAKITNAVTTGAAGGTYSNTTSGLGATTIQGAIDELAGSVNAASAQVLDVYTTWNTDTNVEVALHAPTPTAP